MDEKESKEYINSCLTILFIGFISANVISFLVGLNITFWNWIIKNL